MGMPHAAEPWTAEQVRALPDDGNRYELVSGELVVTPAPAYLHQAAVFALLDRLRPWARNAGLGKAMASPADISLGEDEVLQPDIFVFRPAAERPVHSWTDITELLLAVEVLSPSTARYDRTLKRWRYQRAGVPEYWIVDLDARLVERWRRRPTGASSGGRRTPARRSSPSGSPGSRMPRDQHWSWTSRRSSPR